MNKKDTMNKRILVSFVVIASLLFLASAISAYEVTSDFADTTTISIDGVTVIDGAIDGSADVIDMSVVAGEKIEVKVVFTTGDLSATDDVASDVRLKVTLEGEKDDVVATTSLFDVESYHTYVKRLVLNVPSELDDELSDGLTMNVRLWNSDFETEVEDMNLNVQRPSYDSEIKSVIASSTVEAGKSFPVDIVLENTGYNELDDVYVTVSIPELGIDKEGYFGDLVALEDCDDDCDKDNVVSKRIYVDVPYTAKSGTYTLVVEVNADEMESTVTKEITIANSVSEVAIKSGNDLILLNPTNTLKVYKVVYDAKEEVYVVPAVSSKTVSIDTLEETEVSVLEGETLLSTVTFSGSSQDDSIQLSNPIFVLTAILSIVFVVLLVVLVVLITKKPQKSDDLGESYY